MIMFILLFILIYFLIGSGFYVIFIMTDVYEGFKHRRNMICMSVLMFVFLWPIMSIICSGLFIITGFKIKK